MLSRKIAPSLNVIEQRGYIDWEADELVEHAPVEQAASPLRVIPSTTPAPGKGHKYGTSDTDYQDLWMRMAEALDRAPVLKM